METTSAAETVDIVTVLYNSADVLPRFVESLQRQRHAQWRLVAIDNASTDGSAERLAAFGDPRVTILRNRANVGFARATNQGLRHALANDTAFAILMNNDTAFDPDFLLDFLRVRAAAGADVLAPRILYLKAPDKAWYAGGHFNGDWIFKSVHEEIEDENAASVRTVDFASGCCLGLSAKILREVGFLDERFFVYWEDTDYCIRLKMANVPIYYARHPIMLHDSSALTGGPNSTTFIRLFYRGYMQILMKYFGAAYTARALLRLVAKHHAHRDNRGRRALPAMSAALSRGFFVSLFAGRTLYPDLLPDRSR